MARCHIDPLEIFIGVGGKKEKSRQGLIRTNCDFLGICRKKEWVYILYFHILSTVPQQAAYQHHNWPLIALNPSSCILQSSVPCHTNSAKKYIAEMNLDHSSFQGYAKGSTAVLRWHIKAPLKTLCLN